MAKMSEEEKAARAEARALSRARTLALDAEDQHKRSTRARGRWEAEGMYLTREQALAGEPCRSCGLPVIDGSNHERKGSMYWTPEEKAEYDAEDAAFRERHRDCRGVRWSISGSRAQHCGKCCPPPPMSEEQARRIASILNSVSVREADLVTWSHTLTCGREVLGTVHRDSRDYRAAGVRDCPECGSMKGVVSVTRVAAAVTQPPQDAPPPTTQVRELEKARREVADLRVALKSAEARLKKLTR